ncbi:class II glutamine amidotransferase [Candidatus Uabimicrobium amorphum]|uniref:Class II glutamine amidotransferase n=1 Tax=Uabimicrobium amorphum TaxID=2596890 RepID=A0A5S9IU76_UABAM|nr:class II glutamine amidotransferase [Candidatus Uabimicrobium amorphum]BBM87461.1 class II glutamine amidotransferase [Candidatus Uabimicrobium amorphum]
MCRIFSFRSVIKSQVHKSLVGTENALSTQSTQHPDGWGVAYYVQGVPHIIKSSEAAVDDNIFHKVSGVVSSETVIAHIRKATLGPKNILNVHPFQFGKWAFVHNGNIENFEKHRRPLLAMVAPELRRFILGQTDSEIMFYLILSHLKQHISLSANNVPIEKMVNITKQAVQKIIALVGECSDEQETDPSKTYLTFVLTNGTTMLAHHGGKRLHYTTYKNRCVDRDTCPCFSFECENSTQSGYINHLIFSSEELTGDNIWLPMKQDQYIGVDHEMKLTIA